ncbi:hypothetical protein GGI12_005204 [Dipsacomyces acuminosporus]|nr:hypothetical protein GGI12_005204 [Dipsacomyces acuminosporus]
MPESSQKLPESKGKRLHHDAATQNLLKQVNLYKEEFGEDFSDIRGVLAMEESKPKQEAANLQVYAVPEADVAGDTSKGRGAASEQGNQQAKGKEVEARGTSSHIRGSKSFIAATRNARKSAFMTVGKAPAGCSLEKQGGSHTDTREPKGSIDGTRSIAPTSSQGKLGSVQAPASVADEKSHRRTKSGGASGKKKSRSGSRKHGSKGKGKQAESRPYDSGILAADHDMDSYNAARYIDIPRHSVIDPTVVSMDPEAISNQSSSAAASATKGDKAPIPTMPPFERGWAAANPVKSPDISINSEPLDASPLSYATGDSNSGCSPFRSSSQPSEPTLPIRDFMNLRTTSDIADAMAAAVAGDENALRAIQSSSIAPYTDNIPADRDGSNRKTHVQSLIGEQHKSAGSPAVKTSNVVAAEPTSSSSQAADKTKEPEPAPITSGPATVADAAHPTAASASSSQSQPAAKPSSKASRNVRSRLMKARLRQIGKQKTDDNDDRNSS